MLQISNTDLVQPFAGVLLAPDLSLEIEWLGLGGREGHLGRQERHPKFRQWLRLEVWFLQRGSSIELNFNATMT